MCICQSKQQTNLQTKQSNVMYPGGCERIILVLLHVLHRLNFKFLLSILQILHQFFFFNFLSSFLSSSGRSAKKHLKRVQHKVFMREIVILCCGGAHIAKCQRCPVQILHVYLRIVNFFSTFNIHSFIQSVFL